MKAKQKKGFEALANLLQEPKLEQVKAVKPFPCEGDEGWVVIQEKKDRLRASSHGFGVYIAEYKVAYGGKFVFSHWGRNAITRMYRWSNFTAFTDIVGSAPSKEAAEKLAATLPKEVVMAESTKSWVDCSGYSGSIFDNYKEK